MIPEQIIIMKWNSNNKKYYTEKGYMYTKMHENFEIKVEDLPSKSDAHITLICDYCKQNYSTQRNNILNSKNHCCIKCRHIKIEETYLKRTGFKNPGQNPIVQEKMKQTMVKNHGVEYPMQSEEIMKKIKQTMIDNYGVENASQSEEIKDKKIETCLKNNGVEHALQNEEIRERMKQTMIENHGVEHAFQNEEIREKAKETNMKNYGVENAAQSEIIKEKMRQTNLKRRGVEYPTQSLEVKEKVQQTMYKNGTCPTSKQQQYICDLYNIIPNYQVNRFSLDMVFLDEMVYVEYLGGGHDLRVKLGDLTQEEFDQKEIQRYYVLKSQGWSLITIISQKDWLPSDETILNLIQECKDYLNTGHSWIEINIDKSEIRSSKLNKTIELGKLRKISKSI